MSALPKAAIREMDILQCEGRRFHPRHHSTLVQTNTEMSSLPVIGLLAGTVVMRKVFPSILNWRD
jgi:hypothetical protein